MRSHLYNSRLGKVAWFVQRFGFSELFLKPCRVIFAPVLLRLGVDALWLSVMMGVVLQTSYLTPPFGYAIFYLQGTAPDLPVQQIYRGVVPFIVLQVAFIVVMWVFPQLATWLPGVVL